MASPVITKQPVSQSVNIGVQFTLSVVATSNNGPMAYQWFGSITGGAVANPLSNATTPSLTLTASGALTSFFCLITNASGSVTTRSATLTIPGLGPRTDGYILVGGIGTTPVNFGALVSDLGTNGKDYYLDANYSDALPVGLPTPTFPYLDQGDTTSVVFRQPFEQAIRSYAPLVMKTPMAGTPSLYYFGDANFKDGRAGVYEFDRLFGNIPAQRIRRGQSHTYAFQYILEDGAQISTSDDGSFSYTGPTFTLATRPAQVDSTLVYDYFVDGQQSSYPLLLAPSFEQVKASVVSRGVDFNGGPFPLTTVYGLIVGAQGVDQILAEDDHYEDYRGAIKARVRRLISAPTTAFWGINL